MKTLARWASWYDSSYPRRVVCNWRPLLSVFFAIAFLAVFVTMAFAQTVVQPATGVNWIDAIASLYGPICGIVIACVVLCERIARVIPNSTNSRILKVLLVITTLLGAKVPDNQ